MKVLIEKNQYKKNIRNNYETYYKKSTLKKAAASKLCPSCYQPIGKGCGCPSRGPLKMKYDSPVYKQSCKY